jgi:ribosome-associated protein
MYTSGRLSPENLAEMTATELLSQILDVLDQGKARDVVTLDVRNKTSITDYMVIASGTSERHVSSLGALLVQSLKEQGVAPIGVEGQSVGEWVLVDFGDAIVHVMKPQVREFYQLERLWQSGYSIELAAAIA